MVGHWGFGWRGLRRGMKLQAQSIQFKFVGLEALRLLRLVDGMELSPSFPARAMVDQGWAATLEGHLRRPRLALTSPPASPFRDPLEPRQPASPVLPCPELRRIKGDSWFGPAWWGTRSRAGPSCLLPSYLPHLSLAVLPSRSQSW